MGSNTQTFEVKVQVARNGSRHFSSHIGMYIENRDTRMFHIPARTHKQARHKARKYGRPISVRKPDVEKMRGNADNFLLREKYDNPYPDAIAMDEMIWKVKSKRVERLDNKSKDKNSS